MSTNNVGHLTEMLLAKGLPTDDESSAVRNLRLTNSNISIGALGQAVRDVVAVACKSKASTYIANYERDTKLIITNLIAVAFQWEWLGLGTRVSKDNYLDNLGLARRRIEDITDALIQGGYATLGRGGYRHYGNAGKSKSTQYYPTERLLRLGAEMLYETAGDFDNYGPY